MTINVVQYSQEYSTQWDEFCKNAKNGLFIFERGYLEYHSDRFIDASLLVFLDNKLLAVFPANQQNLTIISHGGLTFGGIVISAKLRIEDTLTIIDSICEYYKKVGLEKLIIKTVPQFFSNYPSGDIEHTLWLKGFTLIRRDLSSILPLNNSLPLNSLKKRGVKSAIKAGVTLMDEGLADYHNLLTTVLKANHDAAPVHSLAELELLITRFPDNLALKTAYIDEELIAGTIVYKYGHVWHTQYLASSETGRKLGGLDLIISSLIDDARQAKCSYLSFGVSTTDGGRELNEGLIWQKESFGARGITHDFYEKEL